VHAHTFGDEGKKKKESPSNQSGQSSLSAPAAIKYGFMGISHDITHTHTHSRPVYLLLLFTLFSLLIR
jgi:hypothetical protein